MRNDSMGIKMTSLDAESNFENPESEINYMNHLRGRS